MTLRLTLALLALLHLAVALAAWLAPYDYAEQHRDYSYAPPTRIHFRDRSGVFHLRPFVYAPAPGNAGGRLPGGRRRQSTRSTS